MTKLQDHLQHII